MVPEKSSTTVLMAFQPVELAALQEFEADKDGLFQFAVPHLIQLRSRPPCTCRVRSPGLLAHALGRRLVRPGVVQDIPIREILADSVPATVSSTPRHRSGAPVQSWPASTSFRNTGHLEALSVATR